MSRYQYTMTLQIDSTGAINSPPEIKTTFVPSFTRLGISRATDSGVMSARPCRQ
jgi:hypothetical protein